MKDYGVLCTMASGEKVILTTQAESSEDARSQAERSKAMTYGPGDGAGRWLAARRPDSTITSVGEAKPIDE